MAQKTVGVPDGGRRSQTERNCTLQIFGGSGEMTIPVRISTRVGVVKELLAERLGINPGELIFVAKNGNFWRQQLDCEEIRSQVKVKGISSFTRERKVYPHPHLIIGTGHNGLRQALWFAHEQNFNFVQIDRHSRIGGTSWIDHANVWSKVQTELGTYHLSYSAFDPCPTGMSPWPSRDELLTHFDDVVDRYGLRAYMRMETNARRFDIVLDRGEQHYLVSLESGGQQSELAAASIALFPGNLTNPRREEYQGEALFDGSITYGMFDETDYGDVTEQPVAIVGFGAFAVENIRTCVEHGASQIYLVCRRKNLTMPRMVSWWINSSLYPISAADVLAAMEPVYKWVGDDPWTYYSVITDAARKNVTIHQKARFGIGDIYFLSRFYGKTEVVVGAVNKLTRHTMHLDTGRKLHVKAILKLLGFVGEWSVDKLLQLKSLVGMWVDGDYRRFTISEFPTTHAQRFGGTSLSTGAITWCYAHMYSLNFPKEHAKMLATGLIPTHKPDVKSDTPGYVLDARLGASVMIAISSACPAMMDAPGVGDQFKRERQWGTHSLAQIQKEAEEDWMRYCDMFRKEGDERPIPPYPFSVNALERMVQRQDAEAMEELKRRYQG